MNNRRKWMGVLVAATIVLVAAATPGGADGVRAQHYGSASDPEGDVPDCRGDAVSSYVSNRTGRTSIDLILVSACDLPGAGAWPSEAVVEWRFETTGDGEADFVLRVPGRSTGELRDRNGVLVCRPFGSTTDGSGDYVPAYRVDVEGNCIGSPESLRVAAAITWAGGPVDHAPDGGVFGPAVAAGSPPPPPPTPPPTPDPPRQGYWMIGRTGDTYAFGDAGWHGNPSNVPGEIVDIEPTLDGRGYWAIDSLGHLYAFGTAQAFSALPDASESPTQARPGERMTSLSKAVQYGTGVPPRVSGLWGFTSRGRVVHYGFPPSFGDMSGKPLNGEVMDSVATPDGGGYYMVASDGGIFTFGNAEFLGSMGSTPLNAPVQSLVPDPDRRGYWLVASDGGIFTFEAEFLGSMGSTRLNKPITGMVSFGSGYLMVGTDGGIFTFGDSPFFGSLGDNPPAQPVVAVAVLDDPGGYR